MEELIIESSVDEMKRKMKEFETGMYVVNVITWNIGRVLAIYGNGALISYTAKPEGEFTDYSRLRPIKNENVIIQSTLGGYLFN